MFGDFFGGGDDIVEEIIEIEALEAVLGCGNCYGTCTCGYGRAPMRQPMQRLGCPGRCYHGQCSCAGYDPFGNLLAAMIIEEIIDGDIF